MTLEERIKKHKEIKKIENQKRKHTYIHKGTGKVVSNYEKESSIICPCCDHEFNNSRFFNDKKPYQYDDIHYECENCKKVISIVIRTTYYYSTYEIDNNGERIDPILEEDYMLQFKTKSYQDEGRTLKIFVDNEER